MDYFACMIPIIFSIRFINSVRTGASNIQQAKKRKEKYAKILDVLKVFSFVFYSDGQL